AFPRRYTCAQSRLYRNRPHWRPVSKMISGDTFLAKFSKVRKNGAGFMASCPAHDDRTPSLSLTQKPGGGWLLHCFGQQCSVDAIRRAGGGSWEEISPGHGDRRPFRRSRPRSRSGRARAAGGGRVRARADAWQPVYAVTDWVRHSTRAVAEARRL